MLWLKLLGILSDPKNYWGSDEQRASREADLRAENNSQRCPAHTTLGPTSLYSANPFNRKILCEKIRVPDRHFASTDPARRLSWILDEYFWQTTTLISNSIRCQTQNHHRSSAKQQLLSSSFLKRVLIGILIYCQYFARVFSSNRQTLVAPAWLSLRQSESELLCKLANLV